DIRGELVGFGAARARLFRFAAYFLVTFRERRLDRSGEEIPEYAEKQEHVHELEDPHGSAEKLLGLVMLALAVLRKCDHRHDQQQKQDGDTAHHTGLPRMRSAARRASDSDSFLIFSRASVVARARLASASLTKLFASRLVRSMTEPRCAAASARNRS